MRYVFLTIASILVLASCGSSPISSLPDPSTAESSLILEEGYHYDESGHWREYVGGSGERVDFSEHSFPGWIEEGEDGLSRTCSVCGYKQTHTHTYEEGYHYDDEHHWKEATCGHQATRDYGEHDLALTYAVENDALVAQYRCSVCDYGFEESTYDEDFLASIGYRESDGELTITSIGDYKDAETINYPSSIDGKPVTAIFLQNQSSMSAPATNDSKAAVYVPSSIKSMTNLLADKAEIDLFYDGTLADWLSIKSFGQAKSRINLHLRNDDGSFYQVEDIALPAGTKTLRFGAFSFTSLKKLRCNDELEKIESAAFMSASYLEKVILNDGLQEIDLQAFTNCGIQRLRLPSSLKAVRGRLDAKHLYEVVIEEGVTPDIKANAFYSSKRLVRFFDFRKTKNADLNCIQPVVATIENKDAVQLHFEQGFVLLEKEGAISLLDYRGGETRLSLPASFQLDGRIISSYSLNKCFFWSVVLSGDASMLSDEEYCNRATDRLVLETTIGESVSSCEEGTFARGEITKALRRVYFHMGKEAMLERVHDDLKTEYAPEAYFLENGEYVRY